MTFIEKFNYLKDKYSGSPDLSKLSGDFAAQITLSDDDCGGIFHIAYMGGNFAVEPYNYYDNTVAVTIGSALLESILTGKADAVKAYCDGEFTLTGNKDHALMMIASLKKEKKEKAAKAPEKPAVKKAEEKKSTAKKTTDKKETVKKTAEKKTEKVK